MGQEQHPPRWGSCHHLPLTVMSGVTDRPCMETGPPISRISDFQKGWELELKKKERNIKLKYFEMATNMKL